MTTTEIKTIKPAGGGDYASANAWELAERADLTSADKIKVGEVYSGGNALTGAISFNTGWTTDVNRYIEIRAATGEEHSGVWDTGKAYGSNASSVTPIMFYKDARITKMQFLGTANGAQVVNIKGVTMTIDRSIIKFDTATWSGVPVYQDGTSTVIVKNSILLNKAAGAGHTALCYKIYGGTLTAYNSDFISVATGGGSEAGIQSVGGAWTITTQNCYFRATNGYTYWTYTGTPVWNKGSKDATTGTDATDSNLRNIAYTTANFLNVTWGSENLRLTASGSNKLIDGGADLSGSGVTYDIIGTLRPQGVAYDIGAFEFIPIYQGIGINIGSGSATGALTSLSIGEGAAIGQLLKINS